jgi:hypothetical protein
VGEKRDAEKSSNAEQLQAALRRRREVLEALLKALRGPT